MSNLLINIRILDWHFQLSKKPIRVRVAKNAQYHSQCNWPHGRWCIYKLFNWV